MLPFSCLNRYNATLLFPRSEPTDDQGHTPWARLVAEGAEFIAWVTRRQTSGFLETGACFTLANNPRAGHRQKSLLACSSRLLLCEVHAAARPYSPPFQDVEDSCLACLCYRLRALLLCPYALPCCPVSLLTPAVPTLLYHVPRTLIPAVPDTALPACQGLKPLLCQLCSAHQ